MEFFKQSLGSPRVSKESQGTQSVFANFLRCGRGDFQEAGQKPRVGFLAQQHNRVGAQRIVHWASGGFDPDRSVGGFTARDLQDRTPGLARSQASQSVESAGAIPAMLGGGR